MSARGSVEQAHLTGGVALASAVGKLAAVSETPRLDAEVLLAFATGRTRASLLAFPERPLDAAAAERFSSSLARRAAGEPLAYVTGLREFYSLPLTVSRDVLIPRPETELLVELALHSIQQRERPKVLDVGTGSGAIAIAVKRARPDAQVTASDVSAAALAVARANAAQLGVEIRCVESAWFAALGDARFDVIVSNPPYVRSAEVRGALELEPRVALDGGADGLDAYRAILAGAAAHLGARDGVLLLEHGHEQRAALTALAVASGWRVAAVHDDLAGLPRALELRRDGEP